MIVVDTVVGGSTTITIIWVQDFKCLRVPVDFWLDCNEFLIKL